MEKKGGSEKEETGERGNGSFSTPCQPNLGKTTQREEDSLAHGFRVSANHSGEGVAKPASHSGQGAEKERASCGRRERVTFTVLFHLESRSWAGATPIQACTSASANPV